MIYIWRSGRRNSTGCDTNRARQQFVIEINVSCQWQKVSLASHSSRKNGTSESIDDEIAASLLHVSMFIIPALDGRNLSSPK